MHIWGQVSGSDLLAECNRSIGWLRLVGCGALHLRAAGRGLSQPVARTLALIECCDCKGCFWLISSEPPSRYMDPVRVCGRSTLYGGEICTDALGVFRFIDATYPFTTDQQVIPS
jgi:hypothetical protein